MVVTYIGSGEGVAIMERGTVKPPCDIVMKGGITSGIVYPAAVFEIAKRFRFVNVGGTSAGAIAAVVTAAAERRRIRTGDESGFDDVSRIPDELAANNLLFNLFRPNRGTRSAFKAVTFLLGRPPLLLKAGIVFTTPWAILGVIPAVVLFLLTPAMLSISRLPFSLPLRLPRR